MTFYYKNNDSLKGSIRIPWVNMIYMYTEKGS